jgi:hypothetical protein
MTVNDISDFCCQTVGDISSEMQEYAKAAIRLNYQTSTIAFLAGSETDLIHIAL